MVPSTTSGIWIQSSKLVNCLACLARSFQIFLITFTTISTNESNRLLVLIGFYSRKRLKKIACFPTGDYILSAKWLLLAPPSGITMKIVWASFRVYRALEIVDRGLFKVFQTFCIEVLLASKIFWLLLETRRGASFCAGELSSLMLFSEKVFP